LHCFLNVEKKKKKRRNLMLPIRIPLTTLLRNTHRDQLHAAKVNIVTQTQTYDACYVFAGVRGLQCDEKGMWGINYKRRLIIKDGEELTNAVVEFVMFQAIDAPEIPHDYVYPYKLPIESGASMRRVVETFVHEYFAMKILFRVLSHCVPLEKMSLRGVLIEDRKTGEVFVVEKVRRRASVLRILASCVLLKDDDINPIDGDLVAKKTRVVLHADVRTQTVVNVKTSQMLQDATFVYGGNLNTNKEVRLDFMCHDVVEPVDVTKHFAYERALWDMYVNSNDEVVDPVRSRLHLHLRPTRKLYSNFVDDVHRAFEEDGCVQRALRAFQGLAPIRRHIFAKKHAYIDKQVRRVLNELKAYEAAKREAEIENELEDAFKKTAEEIKTELRDLSTNKWFELPLLNPFLDWKEAELEQKLSRSSVDVSDAERYMLLQRLEEVLRNKLKIGPDFAVSLRLRTAGERLARLQPRLKTSEEIKALAKKMKDLQDELAVLSADTALPDTTLPDNLRKKVYRVLRFFEHKPLLTVAEREDRTRIESLLPKDMLWKKYVYEQGLSCFNHVIQPFGLGRNEGFFKRLSSDEKLLWYLLSFNDKYPSNYDVHSFLGFVEANAFPCSARVISWIDGSHWATSNAPNDDTIYENDDVAHQENLMVGRRDGAPRMQTSPLRSPIRNDTSPSVRDVELHRNSSAADLVVPDNKYKSRERATGQDASEESQIMSTLGQDRLGDDNDDDVLSFLLPGMSPSFANNDTFCSTPSRCTRDEKQQTSTESRDNGAAKRHSENAQQDAFGDQHASDSNFDVPSFSPDDASRERIAAILAADGNNGAVSGTPREEMELDAFGNVVVEDDAWRLHSLSNDDDVSEFSFSNKHLDNSPVLFGALSPPQSPRTISPQPSPSNVLLREMSAPPPQLPSDMSSGIFDDGSPLLNDTSAPALNF
jgi:hypothetical protein